LKGLYHRVKFGRFNRYRWARIDEDKELDVDLLADKLVPFQCTAVGCQGAEPHEIIEAWTTEFTVGRVQVVERTDSPRVGIDTWCGTFSAL